MQCEPLVLQHEEKEAKGLLALLTMDDVVFIWSHNLKDGSTGVSGNCEFVF
jgi:hypothetical protein